MNDLEVNNLSHSYGRRPTFEPFSLALKPGTINCLLGESGSGKTTLLRCLAGFERISGGEIRIANRLVASAKLCLPPEKRNIGFVFQDFALFPHLSIAENVGFGLHGRSSAERQARVEELLQFTRIAAIAKKFPHQISGGQKQRVALARALAPAPQILFLDEPFSNLDSELREQLRCELRTILKAAGVTALLVTHARDDAYDIADEVGILVAGRLCQWGVTNEVFERPLCRSVAEQLGPCSYLPVSVRNARLASDDFPELTQLNPSQTLVEGNYDLLLRFHEIQVVENSPIKARVIGKKYRGHYSIYSLLLPSGVKLKCLDGNHAIEIGEMVPLKLAVRHPVCFAPQPVASSQLT